MESIVRGIAVGRVAGWALCALLVVGVRAYAQTDPLPSWNDSATKKTIVKPNVRNLVREIGAAR